MSNPAYKTTCDPETGICTSVLNISTRGAYQISGDRVSPAISEMLKGVGHDPKADGPEYLGMGYEISVRDIDENKRIIPFVASTSIVDRYGDVIDQSGWNLDYYKRNPVILWGHDSRSLPIAKSLSCSVVDGKLMNVMQFMTAEDYPFADIVFRAVLKGFISTVSVGFIPLEFEWILGEAQGEQNYQPITGRRYTKSELLETSVVAVPANPECLVVGRGFEDVLRAFKVDDGPIYLSGYSQRGSGDNGVNGDNGHNGESTQPKRQINKIATKIEKSYFSVSPNGRVRRYGSFNPVDSKDADADAFVAIPFDMQKRASKVSASTESSANEKAIAIFSPIAVEGSSNGGFVCELIGSDDMGIPVYRSFSSIEISWQVDPTAKKEGNAMPCGCEKKNNSDANGAASSENIAEKSVVPFHKYPLAPGDAAWDASKEMGSTDEPADWRKMSTIVLADGKNKGDFKLPHHKGPKSKFATVRRGVANALARANQVKGASDEDKAGAKKHLMKHMAEFHAKSKPDGKSFDISEFTRNFSVIESFIKALPEDVIGAATREFERWILDPQSEKAIHFLVYAESFSRDIQRGRGAPADALVESYAADLRTFTNEKLNKKVKRVHKALHAAKSYMEEMHKDVGDAMGQACSMAEDIMPEEPVENGVSAETDASSNLDESTIADTLRSMHAQAKTARRAAYRGMDRFKSHVNEAIDCLEDLCDAMSDAEQEEDDEEDGGDGNGDGTDNSGVGGGVDDGLNPTKPSGSTDDLSTLEDYIVSEVQSRLSIPAGAVPASSKKAAADTREEHVSVEDEFKQLLDAVSEGVRQGV